MLKNTKATYGSISRILHWLVGIMIITMLGVGFYMTSLAPSDQKWEIYGLHKATGVIVVSLVIVRLIWRMVNIMPDLPKTVPVWQQICYRFGMNLMYLLMLVMPSSGILMSLFSAKDIPVYGMFIIPAFQANKDLGAIFHTIHVYSGTILAYIIGFHTLMALYHHFFVKDRLLMRIIVGK